MFDKKNGLLGFLFCLGLAVALGSCSSGPTGPAKGSPAWYWQAANETYSAGDYLKANDHLDSLVKPGNEYAPRAQPWRMIVSGGLASGYMELADAVEQGARANQGAASKLRTQLNLYRKQANGEAVQFAESFMAFQKANPQGDIPLVFSFPSGGTAPVTELNKLGQGITLGETEQAGAERRVLTRALVRSACSAVGADDNVGKAQQFFKGPDSTVPRDIFILAMATKMRELAKIYGPTKIDQPERVKLFLAQALSAVRSVPQDEKTKKLGDEIEKELKSKDKSAS